jgi:hypothetical protein
LIGDKQTSSSKHQKQQPQKNDQNEQQHRSKLESGSVVGAGTECEGNEYEATGEQKATEFYPGLNQVIFNLAPVLRAETIREPGQFVGSGWKWHSVNT